MSATMITVPMKDPAKSKTRLADDLSPAARLRLVRLFYARTLEFLAPLAEATGATLCVVTASPRAAALAQAAGVRVIKEPAQQGLSAALTHAARIASAEGFERFCVIPADLAAPSADDLLKLLASPADVTICPATDQGTNALLVSPPEAIRFQYGPRSANLHLQEAHARGLETRLLPLESLSFDIDTSTCLSRAMRAVPEIAQACA